MMNSHNPMYILMQLEKITMLHYIELTSNNIFGILFRKRAAGKKEIESGERSSVIHKRSR